VESAFQDLCEEWETVLDKFRVNTPDAEMDAMLNFWNVVQCRTTLFWSRFISAYETGLGRGIGTRDSAQDTLAMMHTEPQKVRETLDMLWHLQFQDGHTWHQVFPLSGEGDVGLASEFPDWPQWFSDDHLWLVFSVCAYIKETDDTAYLNTHIPYWDGSEVDTSIWGHILRAVDFTLEHRGPHGLPRSGFSDWNDTLNVDQGSGKAESVWCGQFFCRVMLDLAELCNHLGKLADAQYFLKLHQEMAEIIQQVAWDGSWFSRVFDDNGRAIGVHSAEFQQIDLNSQTWAVLGEIGNPTRLYEAMQQAHIRLNTDYGLALMIPGFNRFEPAVRGTSTYPPGAKENAGIFSHANTWAIIAAAKLGWSEKAYLYYRQLLPFTRTDADIYAAEPYVYCSNICGPEHPNFGLGRNAWLTGTASWMYVAATQYILGIQPTFAGLRIAPTVLDNWKHFSVKRVFRGVTYNIDVKRIGPGGEVSLSIEGEKIGGNIIPHSMIQGDTANVTVHLGTENSMKG
jgi:cellobiose phosphorylase